MNGDAIRLLPQAQAFVKAADSAKKPVAVICCGTWVDKEVVETAI